MAAAACGVIWGLCIFVVVNSFLPLSSQHKPSRNEEPIPEEVTSSLWTVKFHETTNNLTEGDVILMNSILSLRGEPDHDVNKGKRTNMTRYSRNGLSFSIRFFMLTLLRCGDVHPCPGPSLFVTCMNCKQTDRKIEMHDRRVTRSQSKQALINNYICNQCCVQELPNYVSDDDDDDDDLLTPTLEDAEDLASDSAAELSLPADSAAEQSSSIYDCLKQKGLHFLHINIRSLLMKIDDVRHMVNEAQPTVVAVSETWLDGTISDNEVGISGYTIVRNDRNRHGGGVCILVKNSVSFNCLSTSTGPLESIWIQILLPKIKPIAIACCYRPPNCNVNEGIGALQNSFRTIDLNNETYILGDFNINFADTESSAQRNYSDTLLLNNFTQLIDCPTRITPTTSTTIDHILCNHRENVYQHGTIDCGMSDHLVIYCSRKIRRDVVNVNNYVKLRSMKDYDPVVYVNMLKDCNWNGVLNDNNVKHAWKKFKDTLNQIIDSLAPVKSVRVRARTEPWMTGEIIEMIKKRDILFRKFKLDRKDANVYKMFCKQRNLVQRCVKKAKTEYFANEIELNKSNPRKLWSHLKNLGYSHKSKDKGKIILNIDDELCHDPKKVADHINDFFTNIAQKLVDKLPRVNLRFGIESNSVKDFYRSKGVIPGSLKLKSVTPQFVKKELRSINDSKSTGLDGISPRFLKDGAEFLCIPISHIVNLSISTCTVPDDFKKARITPIFKKNSKLEVGNYRPVSILSVVSKILERAVYVQIDEYLQRQKILYQLQSGFRQCFSTNTCLAYLTDFIKYQIASGNYVGMIALDVQKAFDCVNHEILCQKLELMGIENAWFRSYLTGRTQVVLVNGVQSEVREILCGVPQGSLLGPLLYLCYCNEMEIATSCKLVLYADDSILLCADKDPGVIEKKLSAELHSVNAWLVENKLSLHPGKCEAILFGTKHKCQKVSNFKVKFYDTDIIGTTKIKYLGSTIENDLSGIECAKTVIKKAYGRLKFLYRHQNILNQNTRKILALALVQSQVDYASMSWFFSLTKEYKSKLQVLQNRMMRFILNKDCYDHIGKQEFQQINFMNVEKRVLQLSLNIVHKIYYRKIPEYLRPFFVRVSEVHNYCTRANEYNFTIPTSSNNKVVDNSYSHNAIKAWNDLSNNIKSKGNYNSFKNALKHHLVHSG